MAGILLGLLASLALYMWRTKPAWSGETVPFEWGEWLRRVLPLTLGLVDEVAPKGQGMATAQEYVALVVARGPVALELTKALINAAEGEETERPLEAIAGALAASTEDLKEGVAAFRAKRKPSFRNE